MSGPTAYERHDHHRCIDDALLAARRICKSKGARLTELRERVLTKVWQSHRPLGAYAILEMLAKEGLGHPAPPTVYRALDFLQELGLVHRLSSLNAYIGCDDPGKPHDCQFLICRQCQVTVEVAAAEVSKALSRCAEKRDFSIDHSNVEIVGYCPNCRDHTQ
ncbi:Fur family zinc uptake transcriptional regulator [Litorivivens lipolytica]|uniref:Fur family zinc uptake transcriptional regulator n=1 Tax=Litorivivens lipolytica TaxID=1524264 RepID=A0A7W4W6Y8_9GAMM|nr:Fur family transcriptional regulator [Litorivivens lipolytica]MBB3048591.1 Fur family zinc uptake transcriptional regulator [Litorivivens lipolytica]